MVPHHVRVNVAEVTTHRIIRALAFLFSYRRKGSKDFRLHQAIRPRPIRRTNRTGRAAYEDR